MLNPGSEESKTMLYHHVFSLKLGDEHILKDEHDVAELANVLNLLDDWFPTEN